MVKQTIKVPDRLSDVLRMVIVPYVFSAVNVARGNCTYDECLDIVLSKKESPTMKEVNRVCFAEQVGVKVEADSLQSMYTQLLWDVDDEKSNAITVKRLQLASCIMHALRDKDMFLFIPTALVNLYLNNVIGRDKIVDTLVNLTYTKDHILACFNGWDTCNDAIKGELPKFGPVMYTAIANSVRAQGIQTSSGFGLARMGGGIRLGKHNLLSFEYPYGKRRSWTVINNSYLMFTMYIETYPIVRTPANQPVYLLNAVRKLSSLGDLISLITKDATTPDSFKRNQLRYVFGLGSVQSVLNQYHVDDLKSVDDIVEDIYGLMITPKR